MNRLIALINWLRSTRTDDRYWRGSASDKNGRPDEAIEHYSKAIAKDPAHAWAYDGRGKGQLRTRAGGLHPGDDNSYSYNNRAWAHFMLGQPEIGLPFAVKALDLDPSQAHNHGTRAHILEALGRRDEAIADFRTALARNPSDRVKHKALAALTRLGASRDLTKCCSAVTARCLMAVHRVFCLVCQRVHGRCEWHDANRIGEAVPTSVTRGTYVRAYQKRAVH